MQFKQFKKLQQKYFAKMISGEKYLFTVDVDKDELWETYLDAFPDGANEIYRERQEYDCSCCRNFIRQFGNVVTIEDNYVQTIWDFETGDYVFDTVLEIMSEFIHSHFVSNVFVTKIDKYGTDKNYEQLINNDIITWHHFHIELPKRLITKSRKSEESLIAEFRDSRNVFERSLNELSAESIETVLELIAEKVLYKGQEWFAVLNKFLELSEQYHSLEIDYEKHNFCWKVSTDLSGSITKIRNHSIGVLLQDISDGVNINNAVKRYEKIVAPHNYKRPKAIFTKKMVEKAEETVKNLGLLKSLPRRHATLNDITVNNVLWVNRDAENHMGGLGGIFESLKEDVPVNVNKFKNIKSVSLETFMGEILPYGDSFDILVENRLQSNLVSLIAPIDGNSKRLFKWGNNFGWAYTGNITDSSMKERVKQAGGKVDGILRFSLQWNHQGIYNGNDYDAHCIEPSGNHIYYPNKGKRHYSTGILDVDIINPGNEPAVENIAWERVPNGVYHFFVHNYCHKGGRDGFDTEIEYNGELYQYQYDQDLSHKRKVTIAKIKFFNGQMKILQSLPSTMSTKDVWGLKTNQFHTVSSVMYSPNYWNEQYGIGHQHIMFMIAGCKNDEQPNGFFNEYLQQDLMKHRKVFEALGSKMKVAKTDDQLSGLGFSLTKKNYFICKVDNKVYKVVI